MTTYDRLRKIFTDLTLATIAMHAAACTQSETIDRTGFEETSCDPDAMLGAVVPAIAGDYLAIRRTYVDEFELGTEPPAPVIEAETGAACATATASRTCAATLESWPVGAGFREDEDFAQAWVARLQLLYTRGDEVGAVTNAEELRAFLGTIENPEEAMLIARFAQGHDVLCGTPNTRVTDEGIEVLTTTGFACGEGTSRSEHVLVIAPDGTVTIRQSVVVEVGDPGCVIGRLTSGLVVPEHARDGDLGTWFAEMAHLEACAVFAFMRLADELEALGAPVELIARARVAAEDETRHAREVAGLAVAFGGVVMEVSSTPPFTRRSAFEVALENASEGCVRETYGALVATHQAQTAKDVRVRDVLGRIAIDETNHAAFSWDLAAWLDGVLDANERTRVAEARASAVGCFRDAQPSALPFVAREAIGLPDTTTSRALFASLEASVWV